MRLLVTRPRADAARTAIALRERGHDAIIAPLMEIRHLAPPLPEGFVPAILVTSANAIDAIAGRKELRPLIDRPLLDVGDRSAEAAQAVGFSYVISAGGSASDLIELAIEHLDPKKGRVLYLSGRDVSVDLGPVLEEAGFELRRIVVYEAFAATTLPEAAKVAIAAQEIDGVLLYSARSSRILLDLARQAGLLPRLAGFTAYCLSEAVAMPWRAAGLSHAAIAARPNEAALLDLLSR